LAVAARAALTRDRDTHGAAHITEPGLADDVKDVVSEIGVPASTMASMVAFALSQPDDVDVNEILFRPTVQPV
jgi:NADP-dependent 3-hydroxy acid dehydrogenase YdfG